MEAGLGAVVPFEKGLMNTVGVHGNTLLDEHGWRAWEHVVNSNPRIVCYNSFMPGEPP